MEFNTSNQSTHCGQNLSKVSKYFIHTIQKYYVAKKGKQGENRKNR